MTQHDHIVEKKEFSIIASTGKVKKWSCIIFQIINSFIHSDIKNSCRRAAGAGENGRFYGGEGRETGSGAGGSGGVEVGSCSASLSPLALFDIDPLSLIFYTKINYNY
ncbi:unnamed protein product [Rotaria magnacalcarata]|uniref:Uncharacterized protein n=1 Tax=Rotaria magnacalcarata TaxID=392030 RepID=A0A816KM92_9BILA|nr:unnamed protein product [Rotaria magnacalcarata]CAF4407402.1 unnamed protein product [Rotaria magnacalcarata]